MVNNKSGLLRGYEGIQKGEEISREVADRKEQRKKDGGNVFRFWIPKEETREVIILDSKLEEIPFRWEHNLKGPDGKWGNIEPCIKLTDICPICESGKESYYAMYLTVLDTFGYTNKQTGQHVPYTKKLLVIKRGQHKEFIDILEIAKKKHGTIRGVSMLLERDNNDKSSSIGKPRIDGDGDMFKILSEEDLNEYYGHPDVKNKDGEIVKYANADIKPCNYESLLLLTDEESERFKVKYGGRTLEGSDSYNSSDNSLDQPTISKPARPSRGRVNAEQEEQTAEQEPQGTRSRSRSRRVASETTAPIDDDVFEG